MATLSLTAITAVMNLVYADAMADQIRRDVLLPNIVPVKLGKNSTTTWPVKVAGRTAGGAYAEGADMSDGDFDSHARLQGSLAWAEYRTGAKISGLADALSRANGSMAVDMGLFNDEIKDAIDILATKVATHSYSGSVAASPPQIEGLARAVDASSTVYAGIDPATYTDWVSTENTLALTDLSFDTLRENLIRPVVDACGMYPRLVLVPGNIFDAVGALFGDQRRFTDTVMGVGGEQVNLKLRGGFRAIEVDGVPYVEDRHCTANTAYAIGPDAIEYSQVPAVGADDPMVAIAAVKDLIGVDLTQDQVRAMFAASSARLQPKVEMLAKTGDSVKAMVKLYAQLRVRYRNRCGKLLFT